MRICTTFFLIVSFRFRVWESLCAHLRNIFWFYQTFYLLLLSSSVVHFDLDQPDAHPSHVTRKTGLFSETCHANELFCDISHNPHYPTTLCLQQTSQNSVIWVLKQLKQADQIRISYHCVVEVLCSGIPYMSTAAEETVLQQLVLLSTKEHTEIVYCHLQNLGVLFHRRIGHLHWLKALQYLW